MGARDVHVTVWGDGAPVVLVHGSTSWGTDEAFGFTAQRPLADGFRLLAMDRRGYGDSPDLSEDPGVTGVDGEYASDYLVDAADIADLLGDGAHLVGHSYGGVGAMLAAALRPEAVLSLALIEPGCYQAAADDPVVAAALAANREGRRHLPADLPADVYLKAATESVGLPPLGPTPRRLRAAHSALHERLCWEAPIPVAELAAVRLPTLVICGTWENAPGLYRERGGEPLMACARVTAERLGGRLLRVPGASHCAHVERPDRVNDALVELWRGTLAA
ncbi:alpha/beta hydrolase [Actinomadura barringtoniae]|uniref:Alpha/beta hydrolase n=1 Tax=Actinomadura barringtoniae TaxID=1427535 RepID=A0A939T2R1_9ACTN|nr:alpha/beta hydrolase [Actinomadura barringtoniae]MBO2450066.1 alpha/beta hydrolase [Actinomadura barringtoniae]